MSTHRFDYADPERVTAYTEKGPPTFMPGHAGVLQMAAVLLSEQMPQDGTVLVIGAGGGLETRYLASVEPHWRFVGIDPASAMLDLAHAVAGPVANDRLTLIEGTIDDAPDGPFDAATCILVLGLLPDDGSKLHLLKESHARLRAGAPFIVVDQCFDRNASDFDRRVERYAAYARQSGVSNDIVTNAAKNLRAAEGIIPFWRNEQLLDEAGFKDIENFYVGMAWRGWIAYA